MNIRRRADAEARFLFILSLAQYVAQITIVIGAFITFFVLLRFAGII